MNRSLRSLWLVATRLPRILRGCRQGAPDAYAALRQLIDDLGGGYLKLGQLAAGRFDLLPVDLCRELAKLYDAARPMPVADCRAILVDVLRKTRGLVLTIDEEPFAAASIAQVHYATDAHSERCVVKLKRSGVDRQFRKDLRLITRLSSLAKLLGRAHQKMVVSLLGELRKRIAEELDFAREAQQAAYVRWKMSEDPKLHSTPQVIISTSAAIVQEQAQGAPILAPAPESMDARRPHFICSRILRSVLTQMLIYRAFNADPHPGNILVTSDGEVVWVDFGFVGTLSEGDASRLSLLLYALSEERVDLSFEVIMSLAGVKEVELHEADAIRMRIREWMIASSNSDTPWSGRNFQILFASISRSIAAISEAVFPTSIIRALRALIVLDSTLASVDPTYNVQIHGREVLDFVLRHAMVDFALERVTSRLAREVFGLAPR